MYIVDRAVVATFPRCGSLEETVLPGLANLGELSGKVYDRCFVDIGTPAGLVKARDTLPGIFAGMAFTR